MGRAPRNGVRTSAGGWRTAAGLKSAALSCQLGAPKCPDVWGSAVGRTDRKRPARREKTRSAPRIYTLHAVDPTSSSDLARSSAFRVGWVSRCSSARKTGQGGEKNSQKALGTYSR